MQQVDRFAFLLCCDKNTLLFALHIIRNSLSLQHKQKHITQFMEDLKKIFAGKLLDIKAIKLQPNDPFTWASGWKSPFYCDNRKALSYHDVRSFVKLELVHAILSHFPEATAAYVRPKPKDHGMKNQIEGQLPEGAKVVVVEDLISTGGSSLKAVAALREAGFEVVGMVASYTYGFPVAEEAFKEANVRLVTLTDYQNVVEKALEIGYISKEDVPMLDEWRRDPASWRK